MHGLMKLLKPSLSWHGCYPYMQAKVAVFVDIYGRLNLHLVRGPMPLPSSPDVSGINYRLRLWLYPVLPVSLKIINSTSNQSIAIL